MNPAAIGDRLRRWRPEVSIEMLTLLICVYLALTSNAAFWSAALAGKSLLAGQTWRFVVGTFAAMCGLHLTILLLAASRWTVKPLLAVVVVVTAAAAYYQDRYSVFLDPDMVRNVLHTEYQEARELISAGFVLSVLLVTVPAWLLIWRVRIVRRGWTRATLRRALAVTIALALVTGGLLLAFRDLSSLMRNHKEVRYLVNPGNVIYAATRVLWADARQAQRAPIPLGTDAHVAARPLAAKPRLLVIVVGETVRAQNWGLNGYARDTTPQLRALNVVNFSDVRSCGTATEVSLPCMFAPVGRRDYDEERIRGQESLLHVLQHAGIATVWRDNQTGCKGVCSGLPFQQWRDAEVDGLCRDGACFDEILLHRLQDDIDASAGDRVVVLHPLGNHGPSYYARYPERFRRYTPTCDSAEPGECSSEALVNSYDNAVLYSEHFVAEAIALLQRQQRHDTALIYVSDHGESLGEHGLFLHGVPYAIAPDQQTRVPMVVWLGEGYAATAGIDESCLRERSSLPAAHDHLFHSVLGLLDVETSVYEPALDLFKPCKTM
jgi:lipid A ethanolaminephosphotransferase